MELWDDVLFQRKPGAIERARRLLMGAGFVERDCSDLFGRFCPGACRQQFADWELWAILCLVVERVFSMERLSSYILPSTYIPAFIPPKSCKETPLHLRLKAEATHWLLTTHDVLKVVYEASHTAGIADVASPDHTWLVECGASRPSKIWDYYRIEGTEKDRLVFFNDCGITVFSAGLGISEYRTLKRSKDREALQGFAKLALGEKPPKDR